MSINTALYNGLSGLNSYGTALSVVSDNVANANTTAFKSNSVRFGDMVNSYYATLSSDTEREGAGVSIMGFAADYGQGNIMGTENWSDVALSGEGYYAVEDTASGNTYYTRDGSFRLAGNEFTDSVTAGAVTTTYTKDYLINQQGYQVLDSNGNPVEVTLSIIDNDAATDDLTYSDYRVGTDGTLYGVDNTGMETALTNSDATGTPYDIKFGLTVFSNQNGLIRNGSNLYTAGVDSGTATRNDTGDAALYGKVLDNSLEGSNVDLSKEMVDMIIYQASFNANSKTITTSSSLLDTTINLVR